jgi:hypothetical protein
MAEGIMGLAPGMGAPAAPQQAPQQAGPDGMQAFLQAAGQMDSTEVEPQMDEALAEIDPALAQQLQAELSAIQLPPEIVQVLLDVVNGLLEAPGEYAQRRMEVIEAGLPADFLPEEFNVEYLATLRYVLMRLPIQEPEIPVQGFKNGGAVSLKPVAKFLAAQGRNGDTMLAHINPQEAALLKRMGGSGTINPVTGLREYGIGSKLKKAASKAWGGVKNAVKSVGKAVAKVVKPVINVTKKLLANPIVRTVATVAAAVYLGPMAAKAVGAGAGTALSAAVGTSISTAGISLLAGEKPKDALKQGLMAGTVAGVGSFAMGNPLTQGGYGLKDQYTIGNLANKLNPFSDGAPDVTVKSEYDKLIAPKSEGGFGLPRDANTYKLAQEAASKSGTFLGLSKDNAITLASTLGPSLLANLGEGPPPTPEDLNMPGVGGPTGMDLLEGDPGKYGITIGDVSNTYRDPYAGISDSPAFNIGGTQPPSGEPGSMPEGGSFTPSSGFSPVATTMPGSEQYADMFAGYDPTRDPMSPLYNPFALPSSGTSPNTGGFDVAQGFAKGGIATLSKGGAVKSRGGGLGSKAATANEQKYYEKLYGGKANAAAVMSTKPQTESQRAAQQAALFKQQEALQRSREEAEARSAKERQVRIDSAVQAAMQAAQEGRQFEMGPGYASERNAYTQAIQAARQLTPTKFMTPDQAEAYLARQRSENLAAERAKFDQDQAAAVARAKAQEEALAIKAKSDRELADFEAYKASILGPGGSTQPVVPGGSTPPTTGPAPTVPSAPIQDIGIGSPGGTVMPPTTGPAPTVPGIPEINIGGGSALPNITQPPVYGPDGTQYPSASAAITAGVFNYSMTPPSTGGISTLPSFDGVDFGSGSLTSPTNTFSSFGTGSTADAFGTGSTADAFGTGSTADAFGTGSTADAFGSQTTSGLPAFANGGIAAMAPYKFSRGSSPVQHYPRRTGPINGPGTGTSDSIPAMLSDGEFVFTAKAVKGMGNGSRLQGAKKMYKMMKMLEGKG